MGETATRFALLRFSGELSIKARGTRNHFRRRLLHNLRDALVSSGLPPRIQPLHERVFVMLPEHTPGLADADALGEHALARVFGFSSVSLVERRPLWELDEVVRAGEALFRERVRGKKFAVRARWIGERRGPRFERVELERKLGAALLPVTAGVDLDAPEETAHVELSAAGTSFFSGRSECPGGLPSASRPRSALLSGGFDSPVAAWQLLRRGVSLDYVFCNLGGASHLRGAARVAKVLADRWSYGESPRLHAIDFEPLAEAIRANTETRFWQVLLKRQMLRAAERVAAECQALAIVTGDAVGQVSSQTLHNLAVCARPRSSDPAALVGSNRPRSSRPGRIGTPSSLKVVAITGHVRAAGLRARRRRGGCREPWIRALAALARRAPHVLELRKLAVSSDRARSARAPAGDRRCSICTR